MCIIIDTCALASVFSEESQDHQDFKAVRDWIVNRDGKVVFGGTRYNTELRNAGKYRRLFAEFERAGKVIRVSDADVDGVEVSAKELEPARDFDDPHLVAIVVVSGCRLLCTNDKRAIRFVTQTRFYPRPVRRPKIYSRLRHAPLLSDDNVAPICVRPKRL